VSSVDIAGLDLKAVRDKQGRSICWGSPEPASPDALGSPSAAPRQATAASPAAASPAAPSSPAPAKPVPGKPEPEYKITVEKIVLKGAATFTDEAVSAPPTLLKLSDLAVQVDDVTWPNIRPQFRGDHAAGRGKIRAKGGDRRST
jgi:hypothetical protein